MQIDSDKDFFKNFTAETQRAQREEYLPNRETTIGQNLLVPIETCFCLSSSPDKQKRSSLRSLRLCGEVIFICVNLRKSAVNFPPFVIVSRLGKIDFLCVLCVSAVNHYLKKSAANSS